MSITWTSRPDPTDRYAELVTVTHDDGISVLHAETDADGEHFQLVSGPSLHEGDLHDLRHDRMMALAGVGLEQYREAV
jgi:hypothetical protein